MKLSFRGINVNDHTKYSESTSNNIYFSLQGIHIS